MNALSKVPLCKRQSVTELFEPFSLRAEGGNVTFASSPMS
jgi:hypothetical protein